MPVQKKTILISFFSSQPVAGIPGIGWIVLILAILERIAFWALYQPVLYSDSTSYRRLAEAVQAGFKGYDGTRTPGYPVFLALVGPDRCVWLVQMIFGVLITLLIFFIAWQISGQVADSMPASRRAVFFVLTGLAHTLNLGQLFFEANLLTENLTTFWIMCSLAAWGYGMVRPGRTRLWLAVLVGFASGLAAITRPLFIFLPAWLALFVFLFWQDQPVSIPPQPVKSRAVAVFRLLAKSLKSTWKYLLLIAIPSALVVGSYVGYLHARFGGWSLSVMTGYHMIQNTGTFFEFVPDQYAALRDTYLKYRELHIAQNCTQTNTIWDAIPEMQKVSGLEFTTLSTTLARISVQLILEHPVLFLRNVAEGWWLFWRAPVYWSAEALRFPVLVPLVKGAVLVERALLLGGNMLFLAASLLAVFWPPVRRLWQLSPTLWGLIGLVWVTSIVQSFLDHGDNPRFLVPIQSLVVLNLLWMGFHSLPVRQKVGQVQAGS